MHRFPKTLLSLFVIGHDVHGFGILPSRVNKPFFLPSQRNHPPLHAVNGDSAHCEREIPPGSIAKITTVEHLDDFLDFLKEDDRLCIVKFHAAWCKSCQKFGVKFRHLALHHGDLIMEQDAPKAGLHKFLPSLVDAKIQSRGNVRFAQVEFGANAKLCRALEIKRLPSVQFYKAPIGKLTSFAAGPSKFPLVVEKMEHYLPMTNEELEFEVRMQEGSALADSIVSDLKNDQDDPSRLLSKNKTDTSSATGL